MPNTTPDKNFTLASSSPSRADSFSRVVRGGGAAALGPRLDLNGRMLDAGLLFQEQLDVPQHLSPHAVRGRPDVKARGVQTGRQGPAVEVVRPFDPRDREDLASQGFEVD